MLKKKNNETHERMECIFASSSIVYMLYTNEYTVGTECLDKIIISDKLINVIFAPISTCDVLDSCICNVFNKYFST